MASIMKRGDSYSVRYKYKDHSGKPCEGWESFKTKKEAQERKITVEKELLDGTFLVPDSRQPASQDKCPDYLAWKANLDATNAKIKDEKKKFEDMGSYQYETAKRLRKSK